MPELAVALVALGTVAFGAVYPWAYMPLFAAAALTGGVALARHGLTSTPRPVAYSLLAVGAAVLLQLVPLPRALLDRLSPHAGPILTAFSLTFGSDPTQPAPLSLNPAGTRTALLGLVALGLFLVGAAGRLSGASLRRLPRALATFALPLAVFGIISREYRKNDLIYWFWRPEEGGGDLFGPFVNRNHFGGWMLMALCLLVGALFGQVERALQDSAVRRRRLAWLSSAEANGIVAMGLVVFGGVIALFWTVSRSAISGFAVAAAAFAWLALTRHRFGATSRRASVLALGAVLLAGIAWRGPAELAQRFQDQRNLVGRLDAWRDAWAVMRDFPLAGTGLNTYSDAMLFYQRSNPGFHLAQAHNDYVQLAAEGGLLVGIPAAVALALLVRQIRRNLRAARAEARGYWIRAGAAVGLLAIGVQEVFEFSLQVPANALLCCVLAAVALAPVGAAPAGGHGNGGRP